MSDQLLQVFFVEFDLFGVLAGKVVHDLIEDYRLVAGFAAHASGIVHHDDRKDRADSELIRCGSAFQSSRGH